MSQSIDPSAATTGLQPLNLSDLSFLVVEDHEFQRRGIVALLEGLGALAVHAADDGASALQVVEDETRCVDVVICDLAMPAGKVLVVDDNRDAADTTAALMEIGGYEARVAYDPAAALALLDDYSPDVAVLDIGLPGISGYELARRIHAHPNGAQTRLVALTGYGRVEDVAMAMQNGFDTHLAKPVAPDVLLEWVGELMPRRPE